MNNKHFKKIVTAGLLLTFTFWLTACNGFLSPHRIAIQQGNIITQPNVDKLKIGMSPRQVKYVLGTPLLVDTLNSDEWHYIYSLRLKNGKTIKKNLVVTFDDDALVTIDGDYQPTPDNIDSKQEG